MQSSLSKIGLKSGTLFRESPGERVSFEEFRGQLPYRTMKKGEALAAYRKAHPEDEYPKSIYKDLTLKQQRFVEAWMETRNVSKAARIAGYTSKTTGYKVLRLPKIRDAIRAIMAESAATVEEVMATLSEQMRANPADYVDEKGRLIHENLKSKGHLLRKIETEPTFDGKVKTKVEVVDQQEAAKILANIHGLVGPAKVEVNNTQANVDVKFIVQSTEEDCP